MNKIEKKEILGDLVKKTRQELRNDEEYKIRSHVYAILEFLGGHDKVMSTEESILEMDRDGCDNFFKVRVYLHTLNDAIVLSR